MYKDLDLADVEVQRTIKLFNQHYNNALLVYNILRRLLRKCDGNMLRYNEYLSDILVVHQETKKDLCYCINNLKIEI